MMVPREGQIVIDGIDISTLSSEYIRSQINVVPQDSFVMPGTVRFNLDPQGNISDKELVRSLTRVGLWIMVQSRGGLDENMEASSWSSGQKQLFCMARALLRKRKILILDEATSRFVCLSYYKLNITLCSVDDEAEAIMQEIIDTDFKECTVLSIMHRLKYVERYDRMIVMDCGLVVEDNKPK
jgi:ABC-type multidrug transport system fused ATPase/permease subunit